MTVYERRASRQEALVPLDPLSRIHAVVVGVGAVGRQLAIMLAAMGVPRISLIDPDIVGQENLNPQGWFESEIDRPKVDCAKEIMVRNNSEISVDIYRERFGRASLATCYRRAQDMNLVVFSCVDNMETRRSIFESCRLAAGVVSFFDARAASRVIQVYSSINPGQDEDYESSLFSQSDAYVGACSSKMTIYMASIAAGLICEAFSKFLLEMTPSGAIELNLLSEEMSPIAVDAANQDSLSSELRVPVSV